MRNLMLIVGIGGPAGLFTAAFAFQHLGDLNPCALCVWQRWPHAAVIALGMAYLAIGNRFTAFAAALACAAGAGIAAFHTGVELGLWQGLPSCAGPGISGLSGAELLDFSGSVQPAGCDTPAWVFLGLSMASWNGLASAALCLVWLLLAAGIPRRQASSSASQYRKSIQL